MGVSSKYHVNQSMYVTGHFQNYSILKSRLDIYKLSFVPNAIVESYFFRSKTICRIEFFSKLFELNITLQSEMYLSLGERY